MSEADLLARFYDLDTADERDDIPLYLALASASDGDILELACGSGRLAVPIAAAGHDVTGVDLDPAMLERARVAWRHRKASNGRLDLMNADVSALAIGRTFDLVILGFNSILLFATAAGQRRVLEVMAAHLAADGRAVIDVWLPSKVDLELYDGRVIEDWRRLDPATNGLVVKRTSAQYASATRTATVDTMFEMHQAGDAPNEPSRMVRRRDEVRFVTAAELLELIDEVGLQPQMILGDYAMNDYEPGSERLIVVAARQQRRSDGE